MRHPAVGLKSPATSWVPHWGRTPIPITVPTVNPDDWFRILTIAVATALLLLFLFMQHVPPVQIQN